MTVKKQKNEAPDGRASAKPIALSAAFGIGTCILLLLLMSVVVAARDVPHSFIEPMAIFAVSAGGFVAGFLCAKAMRSGGLLYGGACGAVITLVVLAAGIAGGSGLGIPALFRVAFILLSSMLGGVIGVNMRIRRRK